MKRMWLVDHSYGAALVYAASKQEAMDIGDAFGEVSRVIPFSVSMAFSIGRRTDSKDGSVSLAIEADETWEFGDAVDAFLAKHKVALNAEEFKAMHRHKA